MARPVKQLAIPSHKISELAKIGCTDEEIASICEIDRANLQRRFAALLRQGRDHFKSQIRKFQYKRAEEGSDSMLIFLGKVMLHQKEQPQELAIGVADTLAAFVQALRQGDDAGRLLRQEKTLSVSLPDKGRSNGETKPVQTAS